MSSGQGDRINLLSRQLRNTNIDLFANQRRIVGSTQLINVVAEQWTYGIRGKLKEKSKMKMRVIRTKINSLWGKYLNKEIKIMGHNLLLIRLNSEAERDEVIADGPWLIDGVLFHIQKYYNHIPLQDYTFDKQIFTLQFKYLKLEHMNIDVIDEAISFIGRKISTKPRNCRPRAGNTVKARIEVELNKSLHRGGWWKTVTVEDAWIRYHWELQPKNICPKCFVIDHDDEKYKYTSHLLYLDSLTVAEYEALLKEDSEATKENEGSSSACNMEEEIFEDGNIEDSKNVKRMINSSLNAEPSMNPHNIRIQSPAVMQGYDPTNVDLQHNSMMESDESTATISAPMNDCIRSSSQDQLFRLQNEPISNSQHNCLSDTNKQLEMWFDIKTEFYKQKSGDKFIVDMDNNSKYFHTLANRRMFRKNIDCLYDSHGAWYDNREDIANILVSHFSSVSCSVMNHIHDDVFDIIPTVITNDFSEFLTRIPSADDVFQVVKDMASWCSPGPDGFRAGFYHVNWDIVGNDVVQAVQSFFSSGYMPREFNKTYLSLIPKNDKAKYPADFRPIGLCNTIYKIISKILANRIKPYLKRIISPFQSAFVPGRAIQDNIIIAHEMVHTMKHKEGNSDSMALKLDLSKAFDRLEWSFILGMLKKLGFPEKFCKYIEQCIPTTKISILLNGSPTSAYNPTRGLRQGDPLSPYLFIIAMDYLSRLLVNDASNHAISGVKAARNAHAITHLLFADDILIFTKADRHNVTGILNTLNQFSNISGQLLNLNKSSVYFSNNMSPTAKHDLSSALNMIEMQDTYKYLGVTLLIGRDKSKAFKPLIQSFYARLIPWKGKNMNYAARSTMVKHVLNALPTHQMSVFRVPKNTIAKIDTIQRQFWWGKDGGHRGIYFIGWDKLQIPKALGGIGFRNLEHLNTALLTKIAWNACDDSSLCYQILRAKYSRNGSLLYLDKLKDESSWLWRSIYSGLEVVQQHIRWLVSCGTKINIWLDVWVIGLNSPPVPVVGSSSFNNFTFVCDLFVPGTRQWDINIVNTLFSQDCVNLILNMRVPNTGTDKMIWMPDRKGKFTVKNAYNTICSSDVDTIVAGSSIPTDVWKNLWKFRVPHRVHIFFWKCLKKIVHVKTKIARYKHGIETQCSFCKNSEETINHIFMECSYSRAIWFALNINIDVIRLSNVDFEQWLISWFHTEVMNLPAPCLSDENLICRFMCIIWYIWKDRCSAVFQDKKPHLQIENWRPPDKDFVKTNIDGSYISQTKQGTVGLILRNFAGACLGAKVKSISEDELQVHWFNQISIQVIKNKFTGRKLWFCKFVNRLCNNAAHELAKRARLQAANFSFSDFFPDDILSG
ncbi:uncharacterized protein LOC113312787 [Papaver somniferum]|uniref:uncharacterized protein LOC113312787 n=1 Tax=Papaver somniferum TaxID=3469 RepID=UPI000E6F64E8|nr:uncharacterized protein LOC113312787 [Papaver somniferum]